MSVGRKNAEIVIVVRGTRKEGIEIETGIGIETVEEIKIGIESPGGERGAIERGEMMEISLMEIIVGALRQRGVIERRGLTPAQEVGVGLAVVIAVQVPAKHASKLKKDVNWTRAGWAGPSFIVLYSLP